MIFRYLRRRAREAERRRNAERIAERAFVYGYSARPLIAGMTSLFHEDETGVVVRVCDDWGGKPPHRSWWRVQPDGSCRELSLDEAQRIRPLPVWR